MNAAVRKVYSNTQRPYLLKFTVYNWMLIMIAVLVVEVIVLVIKTLVFGIVHFFYLTQQPPLARASSFIRCLDHTQRLTTVGRTPLDK